MTCYNSELPIGPPGPTGPIGPQGPAGTPIYKVYTALLTETPGNPPTVNTLENTTDFDLSFSRFDGGKYRSNTFAADLNKITITCNIGYYNLANPILIDGITISSLVVDAGSGNIYFELRTVINGLGASDELLTNAVLELRIYP